MYGAFIFVGTFALGVLRARLPKLTLTSIFGSIVLDIICTFGPRTNPRFVLFGPNDTCSSIPHRTIHPREAVPNPHSVLHSHRHRISHPRLSRKLEPRLAVSRFLIISRPA